MSIQNFALIDGKPVFIKDYRHLVGNYKDRPIAICPIKGCGCEMEMVLPKDETIRRSHFRHKSKSVADHSPESIWHYGVKYHIAKQLEKKARIKLKWVCKSGFCKGDHILPSLLSIQHNHIDVDSRKIGKFLPDITLYYDDQPLAVIEVFNTHESSDEKISFYNEQQLPWFEIHVQSHHDYESIMKWESGDGLQEFIFNFYYSNNIPNYCPDCESIINEREKIKAQRLAIEKAEAERKVREQEEYQANRRRAEEFKQKIGGKLLLLMNNKKTIPLGFNLTCSDCNMVFPQAIEVDDIARFNINDYIEYLDDVKLDIVFYNNYNEPTYLFLIKKKNSSNDVAKSAIRRKFRSSSKKFIEIEINEKENTFKVIDSSFHEKNQKPHICNICQTSRNEKERIRLAEIKAKELEMQKKLKEEIINREIEAKKKLEEKRAGIVDQINTCQSQINTCLEKIRLSRSNDEKETARQELRTLKDKLESLNNSLSYI